MSDKLARDTEQKVALYARVSTENQELDRQEEKLKLWVESKGYDWDLYSEKVSSIKERPKFNDILDSLDEYDALVVTKIDRFARSIRDFLGRLEQVRDHDVEFITVDEPIDTSSEYGDFMMKLLALFAEFERKMIRRRLKEGFEEALEEGTVGRPRKDVDKDKLKTMYERGASYEFMANEFDVSQSTIKNRLTEIGKIGNG